MVNEHNIAKDEINQENGMQSNGETPRHRGVQEGLGKIRKRGTKQQKHWKQHEDVMEMKNEHDHTISLVNTRNCFSGSNLC